MINQQAVESLKKSNTGLLDENMDLYVKIAKYILACPEMQGGEFGSMGFFSAVLIKKSEFVDGNGNIRQGAEVESNGKKFQLNDFVKDTQVKFLQAIGRMIRDEMPDVDDKLLDQFVSFLIFEEPIYKKSDDGLDTSRINPQLKVLIKEIRSKLMENFDLDAYTKSVETDLQRWSLI